MLETWYFDAIFQHVLKNTTFGDCLLRRIVIRVCGFVKFVDFLPAYGEDSSLSALTFIPPVILQ
jgi:hypothetical protein